MLAVIAKIKVKEGTADEAMRLFEAYLPTVQKEEGTLFYTVNRDRNDPNLLVVMERYRDENAFQVHSSSSEFADLFAKSRNLLDSPPEIVLMDEVMSIHP